MHTLNQYYIHLPSHSVSPPLLSDNRVSCWYSIGLVCSFLRDACSLLQSGRESVTYLRWKLGQTVSVIDGWGERERGEGGIEMKGETAKRTKESVE